LERKRRKHAEAQARYRQRVKETQVTVKTVQKISPGHDVSDHMLAKKRFYADYLDFKTFETLRMRGAAQLRSEDFNYFVCAEFVELIRQQQKTAELRSCHRKPKWVHGKNGSGPRLELGAEMEVPVTGDLVWIQQVGLFYARHVVRFQNMEHFQSLWPYVRRIVSVKLEEALKYVHAWEIERGEAFVILLTSASLN